jgi:hypothetical protein
LPRLVTFLNDNCANSVIQPFQSGKESKNAYYLFIFLTSAINKTSAIDNRSEESLSLWTRKVDKRDISYEKTTIPHNYKYVALSE